MFSRMLDLSQFHQSMFLFGPRQVGKTFLIQHTLSPDLFINLLDHDEYLRYTRNASLLYDEIKARQKSHQLAVIDEIQRCPDLLNEIQRIMGKWPEVQFILTGSSARKLRRAGVNLLGGRAITLHLHPLTYKEIGSIFSIEQSLRFGALPSVVLENEEKDKIRRLKSYAETYLKEEIQQESLTRNIPAFARFLELAAFENGNIINYQSLAREIGIHSKTIKEYFHILEDTLLGFFIEPYTKSARKRMVLHPKFYFFDCGVVSALKGELTGHFSSGTSSYGKAFEHFVILEIRRFLDYKESEAKLSFFRTSDGAEVDIIIEFPDKIWAIEIKSSSEPALSELKGIRSFMKDHKYNKAFCVCQTPRPYLNEKIEFIPWRDFLTQLSV